MSGRTYHLTKGNQAECVWENAKFNWRKKSLLYEYYVGTFERYLSNIKLISSLELQGAASPSSFLPYLRLT